MTPTIEAHGLLKRYGTTAALDGLDLVAERGQVVAVLGPNGAGKTTFVRAVATLLTLDEGSLRVAGHDVRKEPEAVRRAIGLAGQFAAVEPTMTGRENLELVARLFGQGARSARANAAAVLEQLGLAEAADRRAKTYSGGMRRKLDLAASLVGTPRPPPPSTVAGPRSTRPPAGSAWRWRRGPPSSWQRCVRSTPWGCPWTTSACAPRPWTRCSWA